MPKFRFTAIAEDGTTVSGLESAQSLTSMRTTLQARALVPVQVAERKNVLQFEITRRKVPRKDLMHFSRQLAVFVKAGISLLDALETIGQEVSNKLLRAALRDMSDALESGETLADAVSSHPEVFPPFYVGIVRSAESTGNLDTALEQLSDYIERDLEARRKITSALVYPAVVAVVAVVTVVVLTTYVLPRFEKFFQSLNAKLPLATRILLDVSHFIHTHWYLFAVLAALAALTALLAARTRKGNELRDRVLLRIPVLGDLIRHAILERFCRILSSMVRAGVPLPEAMRVTAEGVNNSVYRKGIFAARDAMLRGEGLAAPLAATNLFPAAARQMFAVGEATGTLDAQLETAAVYFDRELDYKVKQFTSLFEPAVILAMGVVVGFVAIALVSAMYGIFRQSNLG